MFLLELSTHHIYELYTIQFVYSLNVSEIKKKEIDLLSLTSKWRKRPMQGRMLEGHCTRTDCTDFCCWGTSRLRKLLPKSATCTIILVSFESLVKHMYVQYIHSKMKTEVVFWLKREGKKLINVGVKHTKLGFKLSSIFTFVSCLWLRHSRSIGPEFKPSLYWYRDFEQNHPWNLLIPSSIFVRGLKNC